MKNVLFLNVLLISLLFLNACQMFNKKNTNKQQNEIVDLIIDRSFFPEENKNEIQFNKVALKDSILNLNISYKGESLNDSFDLIFNGMYAKSFPAKATLFLVNKNQGEKEFTKDLKFNIAGAKYHKGDKTIIYISGYSDKLILNHKSGQ